MPAPEGDVDSIAGVVLEALRWHRRRAQDRARRDGYMVSQICPSARPRAAAVRFEVGDIGVGAIGDEHLEAVTVDVSEVELGAGVGSSRPSIMRHHGGHPLLSMWSVISTDSTRIPACDNPGFRPPRPPSPTVRTERKYRTPTSTTPCPRPNVGTAAAHAIGASPSNGVVSQTTSRNRLVVKDAAHTSTSRTATKWSQLCCSTSNSFVPSSSSTRWMSTSISSSMLGPQSMRLSNTWVGAATGSDASAGGVGLRAVVDERGTFSDTSDHDES
jgi:hypothetical protein